MAKRIDQRLEDLSILLDNLSKKAAAASDKAVASREQRQAKIEDQIGTVKGDIIAMEERIRLADERNKSKLGSHLLKVQMTLETRAQNLKDARDKKHLERYIDGHLYHIADVFDTISYLISDAELSILELAAAADEYEERFGVQPETDAAEEEIETALKEVEASAGETTEAETAEAESSEDAAPEGGPSEEEISQEEAAEESDAGENRG